MQDNQLAKLKEWFSVYITKYHSTDSKINSAIELKIHHTALVCDNIKTILQDLNWSSSDVFTAEATGLLHDIGRLPQINDFGTFNDYKSIDHGVLGVQVLLDENVLQDLPGSDQRIVLTSVKWHNKYAIPNELPEDEVAFLKLVRDADKLDIMRLFAEYYPICADDPSPLLEFDLPKAADCSEKIAADILSNRMANIKDIKNLNDLRIIKLGWVYDLNYTQSKRLFREREYIEQTMQILPATPRIQEVIAHLQNYLEKI